MDEIMCIQCQGYGYDKNYTLCPLCKGSLTILKSIVINILGKSN